MTDQFEHAVDYYEKGRQDYRAWVTSRHYKQFDLSAHAEVVMRLFLPPVPQDLMQVQRPLPKPHQAWLNGFNDAKQKNSNEDYKQN